MSQSYTCLHYHFVFATRGREPTITPALRADLYGYLGGVVRNEGGVLLAVGGMSDHVHLLARLNQNHTVADVMRTVKACSSKMIHEDFPDAGLWWQNGYGAFAVSYSGIDDVRRYIETQEEHHAERTFEDEYRLLLDRHNIEYDEKYLWG